MQFDNRSRRSKILRDVNEIKASDSYTFTAAGESNLCMYELAPKEEISLHDFEDIAAQRLKALRKIEELKHRHEKGTFEDFMTSMSRELNPIFEPCVLHKSSKEDDRKSIRRNDVIGHFALRLAFCRSPEDTKWFVTHEIELFKYRFHNETKSAIMSFFKDNAFDAVMMNQKEKESKVEELAASYGMTPDHVRTTDIWEMDAIDALELVRKRKVLLRMGKVYLPYASLITIIVQRLRTTINGAMARAHRYIGLIEEQDRLLPRLERLSKGGFGGGKEYNASDGHNISRHQIDSAASQFFPLCMTSCHSHLRNNHHLKHGARRQYGLFLKAIGLPLEGALAFFRDEFTQNIDSDKFDKQYGYNIRHMYGKEGKRQDYAAFSCAAIILNNAPAYDDCHGCPFKHCSEEELKSRLKATKMKNEHIEEIVALSKMNQFDKACTLQWEVSRGREPGTLQSNIVHPNQYYELAREASGGLKDEVKNEVKVEQNIKMEVD